MCKSCLLYDQNPSENTNFHLSIPIEKEQVQSTEGAIRNINEFSEIAKEDFREAYRLFTDKNFGFILRERNQRKYRRFIKDCQDSPSRISTWRSFL